MVKDHDPLKWDADKEDKKTVSVVLIHYYAAKKRVCIIEKNK